MCSNESEGAVDRLVAFIRQFSQCVHLSRRCVITDGLGIAAGIGAVADVHLRFTVVQDGS